MLTVKKKEIKTAIELYQQAKKMLRIITRDRPISALSERDYARAEYWAGKIIGMEDVFQVLSIDYRRKE